MPGLPVMRFGRLLAGDTALIPTPPNSPWLHSELLPRERKTAFRGFLLLSREILMTIHLMLDRGLGLLGATGIESGEMLPVLLLLPPLPW